MPAHPPQLTPADVRKVASLSRLAIPDDQIERYRAELAAVLGYVERLRELDLSGIEPLTHVGDEDNRLDDDVPGPTLPNAVAMGLAPEPHAPFYGVPKVLGEGGGA
ncbi:MAG TPA: Asp-tRNA(Asn)/Glu-tRNA(Gln) amidotransferase subunit GatC [Phycisphaerales bacterium]|nr:Asp-tRNA(Asn)/Glu-tRNA(Gln) amidotransferase subunit GatC [Phycisphaerales bacterium]